MEKLGEKKVREMLVANQFEAHAGEEVQEWFARHVAVSILNEAKITKWVAIVGAVAAVVAEIASGGVYIK